MYNQKANIFSLIFRNYVFTMIRKKPYDQQFITRQTLSCKSPCCLSRRCYISRLCGFEKFILMRWMLQLSPIWMTLLSKKTMSKYFRNRICRRLTLRCVTISNSLKKENQQPLTSQGGGRCDKWNEVFSPSSSQWNGYCNTYCK